MLTKQDKKFFTELLDERFQKNNEYLIKEMVSLFNSSNAYIKEVDDRLSDKIDKVDEKLSDKIDKVLDQLKTDDNSINDHERRIGKLEDKVISVSA